MQITFLGTAAAFGYPEPFCNCEDCQKARQAGGKSLRKRASALINNDLLIDLGPDIMTSSQVHGVPLTEVQYCLQTHPHPDHVDMSHLLSRSRDIGIKGASRLHIYASLATLKRCEALFEKDIVGYGLFDAKAEEDLKIKLHPIEVFQPVEVGSYRVIPIPANHAPGYDAYLYAIQQGEHCIFYGTDTDKLTEDAWEGFHKFDLKFDLVVFDHTNGSSPPGFGHMNAELVIEHMQRMVEERILKQDGEVYITHIAHQRNPNHADLVKIAKQNGYQVAYDGLVVDIGQ
jgi:phosphoribosyl 1,2-cyclic phosphodiesterase